MPLNDNTFNNSFVSHRNNHSPNSINSLRMAKCKCKCQAMLNLHYHHIFLVLAEKNPYIKALLLSYEAELLFAEYKQRGAYYE